MKRIAAAEWTAAREFAAKVIEALSPLTACTENRLALPDWIAAHRTVLSSLTQLGLSNDDGEISLLSGLEQAGAPSLALDLSGYAGLFEQAILTKREPVLESPHPRLFLWKPLDARLLTADVIVLAGLNEGCWPQGPDPDPWLNRRDRTFLGLPPQERRIGQAAHDFEVLATSAPLVILTRAKKENGSLSRPSRWVSRIKALAAGAGRLDALEPDRPWLAWAGAHRFSGAAAPINAPKPTPPLATRPRRLSVTAIETWFANPYAIYARHILGLEPLRRLDETNDARDKGILYHAALHRFFQAYPGTLPENAASVLLRELEKAAEEMGFNLQNAPFWRPRFARFAAWFTAADGERRAGVQVLKSEAGGRLAVDAPGGPFEITARADRIDRLTGNSLRIYDFKTSMNTAKVSAGRGAPQLALEGLLAREGAFAGIPAGSAELLYIVATGGEPPGEIVTLKVPSAEAIEAAYKGTFAQIARFDDEATAYGYETRAIFRDKTEHDPYAHLARVQEWAAGAGDAEVDDE
jgi:ATP-dependent helicase/nuclease subunit B